MSMIVYGIDGIDVKILESVCPDFFEFLQKFQHFEVYDDTLGRGWSKIYTGELPTVTNAYFQMPVADGTYKIEKNYNLQSKGASNDNLQYLWQVADDLRVKSVFVNMPTASPAPKNGKVFIAGMGGGRYPQDGMDESLYYPNSLRDALKKEYPLDQRLSKTALNITDFCENLSLIHSGQLAFFKKQFAKNNAQFGFYVNKVTVELAFLAYYDLLNPSESNASVRDALERHFTNIFLDFKKMLYELKPEKVLIVSDHGTAPYKFDINIDLLLERLGYLHFSSPNKMDVTIKYLKKWAPKKLKNIIKSKYNLVNKRYPLRQPKSGSIAFSTVFDTGNFCGIYLIDERFGCVLPEGRPQLISSICEDLNETAEFTTLGFFAKPYLPECSGDPHYTNAPDIMIEKNDCYFGQRKNKAILAVNENFKPIRDNISDYSYPNSGIKSSNALLACNFAPGLIPMSLTDVYRIIVEEMKGFAI